MSIPRRGSARSLWLPRQHGAWAMLAAPFLVGVLTSGPLLVHLPLAVFWVCGYLAFQAGGTWLKSRRRPRYRPPVLVYAALSGLAGLGVLLTRPALAVWIPVFAPLLAVSLWWTTHRAERTLRNGLVTVLAACLMTVVADSVGARPDPARAAASTAVLFAYLGGTVPYVKTMIRERGNRRMQVVSVSYHWLAAAVAWLLDPWLGAVFTAAAARAVLGPRRRWRPGVVGALEIALTTALVLALTVGGGPFAPATG